MDFKVFEGSNKNVWKYVFTKEDGVAEAVLYRYKDFYERTVICCSVMSGCPIGCKFCFPAGTKVLMSDFTYKNIEDIVVGDTVIGNQLTQASNGYSDYSSLYSKATKVKGTYKRHYNGKIVIITTKNGHIIKGTENHPIAIQNGKRYRNKFIPMSEVVVGDKVLSSNAFQIDNLENNNWQIGWLSGFIHGDGVFSKRKGKNCHRWSLSQSDVSVINFAKALCDKYSIRSCNIWPQNKKGHKTNYRFEIGDEGTNTLNELIEKVENTDEYKKGYLAGFWDAEGYSFNNNKTTRVCNTNIEYLKKNKEYVEYFGYECEIKSYKPNDSLLVLETNIPRIKFIQEYTPIHPKQYFIKDDKRVKSLTDFDEVVSVKYENVSEKVYNIETETNTYIANNVVVHNCGTGNKFIRNLTDEEITHQIDTVLKDKGIEDVDNNGKRFQIMFMSMGEPLLNWDNVKYAIQTLHSRYPNAELLLSTVMPKVSFEIRNDLLNISDNISKVGLQFSIHKSTDEERNKLIPYKNKSSLLQIRDYGTVWWKTTGRHPYLNYCIDGTNAAEKDYSNLTKIFSPVIFNFTFSVVCSADETMRDAGYRNLDVIRKFEQKFLNDGYNCRIFDPAGQDDIGGGCGQLWYTQEWMKKHNK